MLSYPNQRLDQLQAIWNEHCNQDYKVDKRIAKHIEVEHQYAHYVE